MSSETSKSVGPVDSFQIDAVWSALYHRHVKEVVESCQSDLTTNLSEESRVVVVPLGPQGDRIWRSLPTELVLLIAHPMQSAIVLVHKDAVFDDTVDDHWKWLATTKTSIVVSGETLPVEDLDIAPELVPGSSSISRWLNDEIHQFKCESIESEPDQYAVRAGLLQILDQLEPSHQQSQRCQGEGVHAAGDYWHGIMHRREPDYGNSKYWFRRVGNHPIFPELATQAKSILDECESDSANEWSNALTGGGWNPFVFVDLCESCSRSSDEDLQNAAREIQWREMLLLLKQTWIDACGCA